jgi:hypothetical protein
MPWRLSNYPHCLAGGDIPKVLCRPYRYSASASEAKCPVSAAGVESPSHRLVHLGCRRDCTVGTDRSVPGWSALQFDITLRYVDSRPHVHVVQLVLVGAPHGVHQIVPFAHDADGLVSIVNTLDYHEEVSEQSNASPRAEFRAIPEPPV